MRLNRLGQWSPPAFMLAGVSLIAGIIFLGLAAFAELFIPLGGVLFMFGLAAVILGMLGLYPQLADRAPRLALTGAVLAAIAGVAVLILIAWFGISLILVAVTRAAFPEPPAFVVPPLFVGFSLGLLVFGITNWRTGIPSRAVGKSLVAVAVLWNAALIVGLRTPELDLWDFLSFGLAAFATTTTGYLLWLNKLEARTWPREGRNQG